MWAAHSHKERGLPDGNKSDSVMNSDGPKSVFPSGLLSNLLQLMFGHFPVRFVIDSLDFARILRATNNSSKIHCRACSGIHSILWRFELRFCH